MFQQRLRQYKERMGFEEPEVSSLLGISTNTYWLYMRKNKPSQPSIEKAAEFAERMIVSLDWLSGKDTSEWWAPHIVRPLRAAIQKYTASLKEDFETDYHRICHLLRFSHRFNPTQFNTIVLAGLATVKVSVMESILAGEDVSIPAPGPDTLADFWHLDPLWLLTGFGQPFTPECEQWLPLIHFLESNGFEQQFFLENESYLRKLQDSWRRTHGPKAQQA